MVALVKIFSGVVAVGYLNAIAIYLAYAQKDLFSILDPQRVLKINYVLLKQVWDAFSLINLAIKLWYAYQQVPASHKGIKFAQMSSFASELDIYEPVGLPAGQTAPVIVFLYGGAWMAGDKRMYCLLAQTLSRLGYCVVVPNYPLYPHAKLDEMVQEIIFALSWVGENASRHKGDPSKLYLIGHSAGAHLAAMTALKPKALLLHNIKICGVIGLSGVYEIWEHYYFESKRGVEEISAMGRVMGGQNGFLLSSPTYIVNRARIDGTLHPRDLPQCLLIHGDNDHTVPCSSTRRFASALLKLTEANNTASLAQLVTLPLVNHTDPVIALMNEHHPQTAIIKQLIQDFCK